MLNCSNCCRRTAEVDAIQCEITERLYCENCADVLLFESDHNHLFYPRTGRVWNDHIDGWIHTSQVDDVRPMVECIISGREVDEEDASWYEYIDEYGDLQEGWVADDYAHNISRCERHGCDNYTTLLREVESNDSGCLEDWCPECVESDSQECTDCTTRVTIHDSDCYHNGDLYCEDCRPRSLVRDYNDRPNMVFNSIPNQNMSGRYVSPYNRTPYFGIELEIETGDCEQESAQNLTEFHDHTKTWFSHDGSLDEGLEIVTMPMTYEYHKAFNWKRRLNQIDEHGYESYESNTCGIHIHISKSSYSPIVWWKVLEVTYKCKSYIKMFAQRNGNYRWCDYAKPEQYRHFNEKKYMPSNSHGERYRHLNFFNSNTVEFRMFRGTIAMERFWSSLEFTKSIVEFCRDHGYAWIKNNNAETIWAEYCSYLEKQNEHHTLLKHLKRRNLKR